MQAIAILIRVGNISYSPNTYNGTEWPVSRYVSYRDSDYGWQYIILSRYRVISAVCQGWQTEEKERVKGGR